MNFADIYTKNKSMKGIFSDNVQHPFQNWAVKQ